MSGIDFLAQVRQTYGAIPFGFITAEVSTQIKETALANGATFIITKPFAVDDVQAAIDPIL